MSAGDTFVAEESVLIAAPAAQVYEAVSSAEQAHDKLGWRYLVSSCEITVEVPDRAFAFRVTRLRREIEVWGYRLDPLGDRTRLSEYWVRESRSAQVDRAEMRASLDRLRSALETRV
ncbi:MAG: hypothetical protein ABIS86_03975 [Streptosporangiaceae bacterium]